MHAMKQLPRLRRGNYLILTEWVIGDYVFWNRDRYFDYLGSNFISMIINVPSSLDLVSNVFKSICFATPQAGGVASTLDRPDAEGENAVKAFTDFLASNNMK